MSSVLEISSLQKDYGSIRAVDNLNLSIAKGSVFGLLGPNGSGKSTTLGMILDVVTPSSGSYKWFGEEPSHSHRQRIGSILEKPNFYTSFTAQKNLELACLIKNADPKRIPELLKLVELADRKDYPFKTFSLGMKQRLAIASAMLSDPEVLILDEPTNGLDPKGIAEIRALITRIAQSGKTIILASHLLDEVQKVCADFAILKKGKLIYTGRVDADFGEEVIMEIGSANVDELLSVCQTFPAYISHRMLKDKAELKFAKETEAQTVSRYLADKGVYVSHLQTIKKNLEQQFMEITS